MWSTWFNLILFSWCITHLKSEIYQDRPKIKTSDGDLIIEPALDKNIYLRPNGPKSSIFIGQINILAANTSNASPSQRITNENLDQYLNGTNGIFERLERLENQDTSSYDFLFNISLISRRINRINRKVLSLQAQVQILLQDYCKSNVCQHGGTCLNILNGYHCLCPTNWEGKDCDVDVNECRHFAGTDLGCQNGAICINKPGSYECMCQSSWYGLHCTSKAKKCSVGEFEMCGHGTCVDVSSGEGIKCICHQGWTTNGTGYACLTDVNECELYQTPRCSVNPRVECINLPGSFRCGQCPAGYEGDGFSCYDIDECMTIPNGGCSPLVSCHNTIGSRICGFCPPGYQGDGVTCTWRGTCNIQHGGCHPSAQCTEYPSPTGQATQCTCPDGMDGDGIGLNGCYISNGNSTDGCKSNPCGDHGLCHSIRDSYTCICSKGYGGAHCDVRSDACSVNPCNNGGSCRPDDTTEKGFRCECTAQYSGSLCEVRSRTCGGVINNEEGSIVYPLTNTTYNNNVQCAWVIHTVPDKVVNVTFSRFNLEKSPGPECYDFLQIHDGRKSSSQLIGRFCGNNFPKGGNIISSSNNLYLWFHSDNSVAKGGFALHWNSINPVCGGEINATVHGQISSPGSPGAYPANRDCYWHLMTSPGKRISLHFFALDIESHPNCSFDYLAIYDGEHVTDPLIDKFCNSTQPAPVQSAGSEILVHFHSDAYGTGNGFQIAYAPVEGFPGCGGYFTADKGEIVSPTFNGKYLRNLLCDYRIKTSADTKIKIVFKQFRLERAFRCKYDSLSVYDGPSAESRLVGKFCGTTYPKSFTSSSNALYFIFKTDRSMDAEGFKISYEAVCESTILGDSGIIKSPGYPFSYPLNKVCVYLIRTTPGKAIQLTFQDFDIEDNRYYNCRYDNVEVRDGPDRNSTLLGRFCGGSEHIPPTQISTHNYMYIKFTSDLSISGTGFYANFTTIDAECGGIHRETTGLINHPSGSESLYKNDQDCTWLLIAPEGMHIQLTWNRFDVEEMPNCNSDYLQLVEIDNANNNNVWGKFCGAQSPPALTTSTNRLKLIFKTDGSVPMGGFSVSYTFLDDKSHCGGNYIKTHGNIYSPGWPNSYEPNRDCTWVITVPVGQQIVLNISDFSIERPIRDNCNNGDYLEIRNGATSSASLIGKYCGKFKSKRIVSLANTLHIHFHSDFYLTGSGFKIEWDGTLTGCGGILTNADGSISSPNYPNNYNENAECFYKIVTSVGSRLRIYFVDLDLERSRHCTDDYVAIYDGRDADSRRLGRYCFMSPALTYIDTSTNFAFIKFRSDPFLNAKGFLLNYITICNNTVTGRYGVIESPNYPNNYPLNSNCLWTIQVPKGNKINVTFTHFDIYKSYYNPWRRRQNNLINDFCHSDFIQYKEFDDINFSTKLCGNTLPPPISTKSNSLQIKFTTGTFVPHSGFRIEWAIYGCGGQINKEAGTISINNIATTDKELECEWLIQSSPGKSIIITFDKMYMSPAQNCTMDSIEVYNGQNTQTPLLFKICELTKNSPSSYQSDGNYMLVRFTKKSTLKDIHFTSKFRSTRSNCGGNLNSNSGNIYSKNYPTNYDNNMNCIWLITVPNNHRIELNILDLDLYSPSDKSENNACGDSIQIYDTRVYSSSSNYTYKICPDSNITQIVSKYNTIVLQFKTDDFGAAKGFKANYTVTCGAAITAVSEGIIKSGNFVKHTNQTCIWTILAPTPNQEISLTLTHMALPKDTDIITNRKCPSSYLRVFNGNDNRAPLIDEYCGKKVPPTIVSRGSALTIEFGSYSKNIAGTFSAVYSPLSNACGGILAAEAGVIASPNYPGPYPPNMDCVWHINTSPGNKAYIAFERFQLEDSDRCNEDYLETRVSDGSGPLLGVYCGQNTPTNTTIASKLYIKFHSNNETDGLGFLLHYGLLHENDIEADNGEIASPLYPDLYHGSGEYTWRIFVSGSETILLSIDRLEIPSFNGDGYNKLSFYDGYDETAPLLEQLYGILSENKNIETSSSVVFIKLTVDESNSGTLFHIIWSKNSRTLYTVQQGNLINCGSNETVLVLPGSRVTVKSPKYPNEYDDDLNCEWAYRSLIGRHLSIRFIDLKLEQTPTCFADSVSIYSSDSPNNWKTVKENQCLSTFARVVTNTSRFMKIKFKTDSSISDKGFLAQINSECGGPIFDPSGAVGPSWIDIQSQFLRSYTYSSKIKCDWTVKVRPGRTIKLKFNTFNITNTDNNCGTSLVLRNGDSEEAPYLSSGKYCGYDHENKTGIMTSSNSLFIRYTTDQRPRLGFKTFSIFYEEQNDECGLTSKLSPENSWEIINSPKYPSVPLPYSECQWVFSAPPGEIIRLDFIDRFDLDYVDDCGSEVVEVRDGSSILSPLIGKGRYCGEKPGTIKSTGNTLYIKYSTQLAEPRNGFQANVSLDVCGGTIITDTGELKSPGYPHMQNLREGTVCTWNIKGPARHIFKIEPEEIHIPHSESYCATKVTIEESGTPVNNQLSSIITLKTFCGEDVNEKLPVIETSKNEFVIKLHIGKPDKWDHFSDYRGFRIGFSSSRPTCSGVITTSEGYLTTPSYPQETTTRYCHWVITVPNKLRKIRLQLIDADIGKHTIGLFDDNTFMNPIRTINTETDLESSVFVSSGPKMAIYLWLNRTLTSHRFKAQFSSDDQAVCGGDLGGLRQDLVSPNIGQYYNCEWLYDNHISSENSDVYNSIFVTINTNSSESKTRCRFSDSKVIIKPRVSNGYITYIREVCGNAQVSFRIPSSQIVITGSKRNNDSFNFNVQLRSQECGGTINVGETPINILKLPNYLNETLECSWIIVGPVDSRLKIYTEGSFEFGCEEEYFIIKLSLRQTTPATGQYCKTNLLDNPLVTHISPVNIEYHSSLKTNTSLKIFAQTVSKPCGGQVNWYQSTFASPNYPKSYLPNQECTWEINAKNGFRVSLKFIDRFVIEDRPNCTKDAVIIYDYKDDSYVQMARICGRQVQESFNSTSNRMKVVFRSDSETNLDGFRALWTAICGGNYLATEKEQFLYSPGYPISYRPHLDCTYKISAPNNKVLLKFLDFQLEGTPPECTNDNLTIVANSYYSGIGTVYCGSELPPILTKYEELTLLFKTDKSISRKGFKIAYSTFRCGGKVNSTTVLKSSSVDEYDENMNCTWLVEAPSDKIVVVKFIYIDVESHTDCYYDYVALYNGLKIDKDKRFALLCGHNNKTDVIKSQGNTMILQFVSDASLNYRGFKAEIYFSYSRSVGCGGQINLTSSNSYDLTSPYIGNSVVYENYLDCDWSIIAPSDTVIKVSFTSFHISSCAGVNQTAIGYSKCDCHLVEIKDGLNPNSLVIGTYCGHTLPPQLVSSGNTITIRLATDGELPSAGFTARLTTQQSPCGPSFISISTTPKRFKSPGYESGEIPRGVHCVYRLDVTESYSMVRLTIINLDLQSPIFEGNNKKCNKDKLIISRHAYYHNSTFGRDYIVSHQTDEFFSHMYMIDGDYNTPETFEICAQKEATDYYLYGNTIINIITSAETDGKVHKGVELEVVYAGFCGRNYSETQGRIQSSYSYQITNELEINDCYTLITAPENYTISMYFLFTIPDFYDRNCYLDILDGNVTSSPRLLKIDREYDDYPVFSTGRYLLLHNHQSSSNRLTYDLNYVTTNKGRGCGGKIINEIGRVTSPMYPNVYRKVSTCEWELETPLKTHLHLHFSVFDLGITCDQNYLQVVDSKGVVVRSFCSNDLPADYISEDNYVKLVFFTTKNNGGTGWVADFVGVV